MSTSKEDPEEGVPTAEQTTPASTQDTVLSKKGPLLGLLALVFALGVAGTAVGSYALKKANDVDSDLDQLSNKAICDGEPTLIQSFTFPPVYVPSPNTMFYVPAWDFQDPSWFGVVGNRVIYYRDPMYVEDDTNFTTPIGFFHGETLIIKSITNATTDFPVMHAYHTMEFNDIEGHVIFGGIIESSGNAHKLPILGGTGYWENFSGFVEGLFDPEGLQFSAKVYQSCQ